MIIGIDTSGKLNQLPMWVAAVKQMRGGLLEELKKSVGKRLPIVLRRRRLDGKYLNQKEIETLKRGIVFSVAVLRSPVYGSCLKNFRYFRDPEARLLASVIFLTLKNLELRNEDVVLIDKDYDYNKMRFLCSSVSFLLRKLRRENPSVEIGTSYNESIGLADIVAKLARLGKLPAIEIDRHELENILQHF